MELVLSIYKRVEIGIKLQVQDESTFDTALDHIIITQ